MIGFPLLTHGPTVSPLSPSPRVFFPPRISLSFFPPPEYGFLCCWLYRVSRGRPLLFFDCVRTGLAFILSSRPSSALLLHVHAHHPLKPPAAFWSSLPAKRDPAVSPSCELPAFPNNPLCDTGEYKQRISTTPLRSGELSLTGLDPC